MEPEPKGRNVLLLLELKTAQLENETPVIYMFYFNCDDLFLPQSALFYYQLILKECYCQGSKTIQ